MANKTIPTPAATRSGVQTIHKGLGIRKNTSNVKVSLAKAFKGKSSGRGGH
jgi:hypothetical protein